MLAPVNYKIFKQKIAGTVILYNSSILVLDNILTYIKQVEKLYVVDNSIQPNWDLINKLKAYSEVCYHSLNGNKGIATALNWAADKAIEDGYVALLTMDDDTQVSETMVEDMINFWNKYQKPIGLLSGVHRVDSDDSLFNHLSGTAYRELPFKETSGNLLSLEAYSNTGKFFDKLFIDHVDHEYGFRLNANGYSVIELGDIKLNHKLGYDQEIKLGALLLRKYGTHPPLRLYYYGRNGVYLARKYYKIHPFFMWLLFKELLKRITKATFFDKDGGHRLKMIFYGIKDGWNGHLGQYNKK